MYVGNQNAPLRVAAQQSRYRMNGSMRYANPIMPRLRATVFAVVSLALAGTLHADVEPGFVSMFNGKDLTGWEGKPGGWSIDAGAITGQSTRENPCKKHHYLYWKGGEPADFILRLKYKIVGGNSGVQFRSEKRPAFDTHGYQADFEAGATWTGCLFQHDRGGVVMRGNRSVIAEDGSRKEEAFARGADLQAKIKSEDWNDYEIVARGSRITLRVNGELMCEVDDRDAKQACDKGIIALQMHPGPPMKVQFKDLRIKVLDAAPKPASTATKPNVLLILADDLGYSDLGCYGGEIETPNLDALADGGLRFTQFYNTGRCWPTRAALLTGYYAQQVRRDTVPGIPSGGRGKRPDWARLLPEMLAPLGYRSYHSGKWHIDGMPIAGGFDRSYYLRDQGRFFNPQAHWRDDSRLPPVEKGTDYYATTAIADHAIRVPRGTRRQARGPTVLSVPRVYRAALSASRVAPRHRSLPRPVSRRLGGVCVSGGGSDSRSWDSSRAAFPPWSAMSGRRTIFPKRSRHSVQARSTDRFRGLPSGSSSASSRP